MATKKKIEETTAEVSRFEKAALLKSDEFKRYSDLLNTVLEDGKTYTKEEVRVVLDETLKRKVVF